MIKKAIACLALCASAFAGQLRAADEPAWYLGGGAGRGEAKSPSSWAGQTDAALAAVGVTSRTSIESHETAWKVFGGYRFNDMVAIEVAYNGLGRYKGTTTITAPAPGSVAGGTWDTSAFSVAAVGTYPVVERFGLLFKAGLAATRLNASVSSFSKTETRVQPMFGVGAQFAATKAVGLRAEFERFQNVGDGSTTGQSAINMFTASLLYRF